MTSCTLAMAPCGVQHSGNLLGDKGGGGDKESLGCGECYFCVHVYRFLLDNFTPCIVF